VRSMASLLPTLPSTSTHMRMHHTHSHTLPISLDTVSESLLVKLATNPACHRLYCPVASAAAAQNSPAAPEPQTLFCVFRGGGCGWGGWHVWRWMCTHVPTPVLQQSITHTRTCANMYTRKAMPRLMCHAVHRVRHTQCLPHH
jgi:hypothetical protein